MTEPRDWYISDQFGNIEVTNRTETEARELLSELIAICPEEGWFMAQDIIECGDIEEV